MNFNRLYAAFAAAALCLAATTQAKATINQAGNLLWTADLPGLATDASVTATNPWGAYHLANGFNAQYGTGHGTVDFAGGSGYPGWIGNGAYVGWVSPAPGLASIGNYLESYEGGPITVTPVESSGLSDAYLGFLTQSTSSFNVTLYSGSTSLGEITAAQLDSAAAASGYAWINIDVANGGTFTTAVFSPTATTAVDRVFEISYGTSAESLGSAPAPLPALAGTLPGLAAAALGMFGLRRRGSLRA
jgi:hypothetical protein